MNEYRNILTGDAARAWKRLAGRFYWLNDSEIAKHLIEVHDQWCGDQCPLVKSCDRGSSGYEMSCVKLEVPPSAKSEAENEDIPLQLEVDEGADSFVDNSSMTKSVDGECGFESDLDPVTYVFNVTDMEGDIKVVTDATDNTPQNTGSTLARTDNLIPASGNKSTDSRAGNLSQTLISVKQEPTDSGEYENFVGQDMETAESKTVHHSPPLTSSHPVSTNTISTAVRAALRQKISSTVDSLPLSTNKWTNSGGDTLTQAIPVVIQEPTDCGEYENSVIQSVETSHHHTQLTSSGATSHPVMSDTNIGVVKQEPTDCGEHENSVIQSVEPTQTKTISHHHSPLTSDFPTSLSVMSNNIVTSVKPSVTQGIPSTKAITLNPLVMGPRSLFPIIPGVNVAQTPCPAAPNPAVVGSQIVLPIAPHLSQTLAPGIAQTLAPGTAQTLNLATSGNVIYPQLLNVVRRGNSLYVAVPASTVTPDLQNPPFTFAASSLPPTIPMAANFLSNVGQGGSVALQPMLVPLSGVDLLSGGQQVSTSSTSLSGAGGEQTDGGCKQMDEKLTSTGATSHPVMSDSMTAALEPVPNHGTSSTNTHPGSLSPVVTGRQNTELATPDTNMDSTVTLATVADTLPPPRVLNIVTRIPASTVTCSSHSMGSTCLSISKSTPNMVADMTPNVNQTPMVVVKPMLVSPAQRVRLQSGGQQYLITKISRTGAGVEACMGKKRVAEDSLYTKPVKRRLTRKKQGPSTSKKSANISETETQSSEEDQSNQKEDQSIEKEDQSNNPNAQWNGEQKETGSKKRGRPSVLSESERKRRRSVLNKRLSKQRIYLGAVKEEWNQLREALNLESNPDLAEFLINHHQQCQNVFASTSPPEKPQPHAKLEMSSTDEKENGRSIVRISEDFEEEEEEEEDSTPDLSLILGEKDHTDIEDVAGGNLVFGVGEMSLPEDKVGEMSLPEDRVGEMSHTEDRVGEMSLPEKEAAENVKVPGIMQILTMEESELVLRSEKVIVFEEQLLMLAKSKIDDQCLVKGCPEAVKISTRYVASALYLVWSCSNKHIKHRWCSQPLLSGGSQSGDLMITAAILCSGNDFCKVKRMADLLHLHFPSQSSFTQLQQKCLVPAIEETWFEHQRSERTKLNDKDVVLLGGGCLCSPGNGDQYCTYAMMENYSKKIIAMETLDKRDTRKVDLEKVCFQRALEDIRNSFYVTEVVTDVHPQVDELMKKQYSRIRHSHDVWQAAKELREKIIAAGQDKRCKDLLNWCKDIVEHFWYSCEVASSHEEFLDIWVGMTHHVLNKHKWVSSYASLEPGYCSHGELDEDRDKKWLKKRTSAYTALIKIVMDKQFLKNVHYLLNFRSTANLEIFNNHVWMHASERLTYTPDVYRARNILAALDYNSSVDLPSVTNEDDSSRYQRTFSKKSGRWIIAERKEKKTYHHIEDIFEKSLRIQFEV